MDTAFIKLNLNWNAEPNAPNPQVIVYEHDVVLCFYVNAFIYPKFKEGDIGVIRSRDCGRYRLGFVNDEGWYKGQCRFSKIAPVWGEFYQVTGDLLLGACPEDWMDVGARDEAQKHFLFYFRDEEFECDAAAWRFSVLN